MISKASIATMASNSVHKILYEDPHDLPQTSGFRSAKEILVVSFATQPRAFILSDRNIFHTPGGENNGGV